MLCQFIIPFRLASSDLNAFDIITLMEVKLLYNFASESNAKHA